MDLLWIFVAMLLGVLLGGCFPKADHPHVYPIYKLCSSAFILLIKSVVMPILISTVVVGIAQTGDIKTVGRVGIKALVYFEVVTTLALGIGWVVAEWIKPGAHLPLPNEAPALHLAKEKSWTEIVLHLFPSNLFKHASEGDILPVVVFATLFGIALTQVMASESTRKHGMHVMHFLEDVSQVMFKYTEMVMKLTPVGVFGAMAANVSMMASGQEVQGRWISGWPAVWHLLLQYTKLVGGLYVALLILVVVVFVPLLVYAGVNVFRFFRVLRTPLITAFTTASSEAALPELLKQTERLGVPKKIAGFVIPTGYSFNLDGSTLYLVLASFTIAQAAHVELTLTEKLLMLLTFMLTSKGVAGVPRATLVIIGGACASFGLPAEAGIAMLLATDELMDMGRTATNVMGNALACVVVSKWENVLGPVEDPEEV